MNERIQKLIKQATTIHYSGPGEIQELDPEKFAELIVKECAQVAADFIPGYGLEPFSKRFNEHFGVEE
jgi:hypothetical protein